MKKTKFNKNFIRLVALSIFIIFLTTSVNSAIIQKNNKENILLSPPVISGFNQNYYEWIDEFNDEQKIDSSGGKSYNYKIESGVAKIKYTCSVWTDSDWTRMKQITVTNNAGEVLQDYALNFVIEYDPDMQSDYDDIRFKHQDTPTNFLYYWIEDYDTTEVSVWVRVPQLDTGTNYMYLFYGNPSAQDQSNFGDVFSGGWEELWANDVQMSYHGDNEGVWDPDVCFDGSDEFIIAWEEGQAYWFPYNKGFKQEIRASIYEVDDNSHPPIVFDKLIFSDHEQENGGWKYYRNEDPSIARGGGKWFVAWEHWQPTNAPYSPQSINTMDIKARTIQRSGNGISRGNVLDVCDAVSCQADPVVVFDSENDQFMVVWEDARDNLNDYDIYAQLYDTNGNTIGDNKQLCGDANSQCEPNAAYDTINSQYFVVWEEGITPNNGPFRVRGGIFDDNLNTIWTGTIAEPANYPNEDIDYNFPTVCFDEDSERYLVTWNDCDISDGDWHGNIYGKIYDSSGNIKVNKFTIKNGNYVRTDIVPYLSKSFFVTFDNNNDIYGKIISFEGDSIGGDVQMSASPGAKADWASIDTDGSEIFVAWEDIRFPYPDPFDDLYPDAMGNSWNLSIPDGNDISYTIGDEQQLILEAQITSIEIEPENLEKWYEFRETSDGTISFDILDENCNIILQDVSSGQDLSGLDTSQYPSIRLRAFFTRTDPSYSPILYNWSVLFEGLDLEPPVTWVQDVLGTPGWNDWYISESVVVYLEAKDYPEQTGSGVAVTYYTLNGGSTQIYDIDGGINLTVLPPDWWNIWIINFWSVDNEGNAEDKNKQENFRTIKIDSEAPTVVITEPQQGESVSVPFWVIAEVTENAEMDYVEFDMYPWGQRKNLPFYDYTPPWKWLCEQTPRAKTLKTLPLPLKGGNQIEIRAWPFDKAHNPQSAPYTIWVNIVNWNKNAKVISVPNFMSIFSALKLGIAKDDSLNIKISGVEDVDAVKFVATKMFTKRQTTVWDSDLTDGFSASFDIPTGFYKITTYNYNNNVEIGEEIILRVFFINR